MHWSKVSSITLVSLFSTTLLISLFFSLNSPATSAVQKAPTLAFLASQRQGETVKNSLFTIKANGSARRELTPTLNNVAPNFTWSPNGQRIASVSEENDIYVVNVDGSRLTKLFSGNFCKASNFKLAWLANNQTLVFTRACDGSTYDTPGSESLYRSDTTGTQGTKLIQTWQIGGIPPKTEISSWLYLSPDGKQVAFIKDREIYKMNTDGSGLTKLTQQPGDYTSGGTQLNWSPDDTQIAFFEGKYPQQQIYLLNADGTSVSKLTNNPQRVNNSEVLWSPDSTRFAYYHTESGGNQIYLLDAKGGTPKNLTPQPGQYYGLHWLANGKQLAYFSHQKLYTINVDDSHSNEKTLQVAPSELSNVAWSSNNQQVAFTSGNAQKSDLYVMNRQGSGLTKLTNNQDLGVYVPAWQP